MGYVPIFVDVGRKPCIVIGGGVIAEPKIRVLMEAGAFVTVVSPGLSPGIKEQAGSGKIRYLARDYKYGDLRGNALAYVATHGPEIARCAAQEAHELVIPINLIDDPEHSSFISPASFRRGHLQIAISTGGASPAVARMLREHLEEQIGPVYGLVLEIMRRTRQFLRNSEADPQARSRTLKALAGELLGSAAALDNVRIDEALRVHLHASLGELGLEWEDGAMLLLGEAEPVALRLR